MQGELVQGLRSLDDGFIPPIIDLSLLDRKIIVTNRDAIIWTRKLLDEEGIFAGVSVGRDRLRRRPHRRRAGRGQRRLHRLPTTAGSTSAAGSTRSRSTRSRTSTPPSGGRATGQLVQSPFAPDRATLLSGMPSIGPMELVVILVIALVVLGPKKLPEVGRSVGKGMREFKESLSGETRRGTRSVPCSSPTAAARTDGRRAAASRAAARFAACASPASISTRSSTTRAREHPNECCGLVVTRDGSGGRGPRAGEHRREPVPVRGGRA